MGQEFVPSQIIGFMCKNPLAKINVTLQQMRDWVTDFIDVDTKLWKVSLVKYFF